MPDAACRRRLRRRFGPRSACFVAMWIVGGPSRTHVARRKAAGRVVLRSAAARAAAAARPVSGYRLNGHRDAEAEQGGKHDGAGPPPQSGGGGPCEAWWRGRTSFDLVEGALAHRPTAQRGCRTARRWCERAQRWQPPPPPSAVPLPRLRQGRTGGLARHATAQAARPCTCAGRCFSRDADGGVAVRSPGCLERIRLGSADRGRA